MKKIYQKHSKIRWLIVLPLLLIIVIIIHSCKKDQSGTATDAVSVAKQWYESTYPVISASATSGRLLKVSVGATSSGTTLDFSQIIKPDWGNAAHYKRLAKDVLELPITSPSTFAAAVKTGAMVAYNKQNSRSSFILLNDGKTYQAFVMMFVADSTYLNKDYTKLGNNTYRHIDKTFSGWLYYFTPKGAIVSGYKYKAGHIVNQIAITNSNKALISTHFGSNPVKTDDVVCTDWYADFYENGVLVNTLPLGSTCIDDGIYAMPNPNPGGGGADDGPPPPIEEVHVPIDDPCNSKATAVLSATWDNKLAAAKNNWLTLDYENAYLYTNPDDINTYNFQSGNTTQPYVDIQTSVPIKGIVHTHPSGLVDANGNPIPISSTPTPDDFQSIYDLLQGNKIANPATFTSTVLTGLQSAYMITITDSSTLKQWGATAFQTASNGQTNFYNNVSSMAINLSNSPYNFTPQTAKETSLLYYLQNAGISMLRGDINNLSSSSSWLPITYNSVNATILTTPCPTN